MIERKNTSLFALVGIMGAFIIIGAYLVSGSMEMLSKPPTIALSAFPVFLGSIFSGMSLASTVKEKEEKSGQRASLVELNMEMNHAEHSVPSHIQGE